MAHHKWHIAEEADHENIESGRMFGKKHPNNIS